MFNPFKWWRNRRRKKLLEEPFPTWWEAILKRNVGHYPLLKPAQQKKLQELVQVLIAEKSWEGINGLHVTPEMQVTIAGQMALMLLGLEHDYFANVLTVVVHPTNFATPNPDDDWEDDELSDTMLSGQAVYRGPVILAWKDVLAEGRNPSYGSNVVIHEFAHQLDFSDTEINGTPPLDDPDLAKRWGPVMQAALDEHRRALLAGEMLFFTEHAADDETEFFADASEAFFCVPHDLEAVEPKVFELLAAYYKLDPREWFAATPLNNP